MTELITKNTLLDTRSDQANRPRLPPPHVSYTLPVTRPHIRPHIQMTLPGTAFYAQVHCVPTDWCTACLQLPYTSTLPFLVIQPVD